MSKKVIALAFQLGIVALAFSSWAYAQTTSGLITGTITDSTGAVMPGAQVQLTSQATGVQRNAVTDSSGYYSVPELQPGVYDVSVSKDGFANQKFAIVNGYESHCLGNRLTGRQLKFCTTQEVQDRQ